MTPDPFTLRIKRCGLKHGDHIEYDNGVRDQYIDTHFYHRGTYAINGGAYTVKAVR